MPLNHLCRLVVHIYTYVLFIQPHKHIGTSIMKTTTYNHKNILNITLNNAMHAYHLFSLFRFWYCLPFCVCHGTWTSVLFICLEPWSCLFVCYGTWTPVLFICLPWGLNLGLVYLFSIASCPNTIHLLFMTMPLTHAFPIKR
jgi:hypothetical protein